MYVQVFLYLLLFEKYTGCNKLLAGLVGAKKKNSERACFKKLFVEAISLYYSA